MLKAYEVFFPLPSTIIFLKLELTESDILFKTAKLSMLESISSPLVKLFALLQNDMLFLLKLCLV